MKLTADPDTMPSVEGLVKTIKPEMDKIFKPAFLGRMVIIPYYPIRDEALKQIIRLKLGKIQRRLKENHAMSLQYDDAVLNAIAARCTEVESGARNVDNILTNTLLPEISNRILTMMATGEKQDHIAVSLTEDGNFAYN
jgi:type VI secretion system protein VasG